MALDYQNHFLTIQEAGKKYHISERRLQQLCKAGKIEGAKKEGRSWMIPEGAELPLSRRIPQKRERLPLPVGVSSYVEAVTNYYYVDKTLLIRDFIDTLPKVSLFTRPRRFGKTLNMDMLRVFFEYTEQDTSIFFRDKDIWRCGKRYQEYQGKYPVIYLSFKDVKYQTWTDARRDLAGCIATEFARHEGLEESGSLNVQEIEYFQKIISGTTDEVDLDRALAMLSAMLHKAYGQPAIIIIDEYDTPIQQGYMHGYYNEVIRFIRNLFSGGFKDNPHLAYGFLTGILRVAKESIFSGMNNLKVHTIMDDRFSGYFGFTRDEVLAMLQYYGSEDKMEEACSWYDGYLFGSHDIFNPWSVVNYVDESCVPKAFWLSTGDNGIIGDLLTNATTETVENLRKLMQGEEIVTYMDTDVIYPMVKSNSSSIYSFLLMTGYLKNAAIIPQDDGSYICRVRIPNKEIAFVYAREIIARMQPGQMESTASQIGQAIFEKDVPKLQQSLETYLIQTISYYDSSDEAFYQGLMIGLCAILNNRYAVRSNRESGLGRFDIYLLPLDPQMPGFILELKTTKDVAKTLDELAKEALDQIDEKKYDVEMQATGVKLSKGHFLNAMSLSYR